MIILKPLSSSSSRIPNLRFSNSFLHNIATTTPSSNTNLPVDDEAETIFRLINRSNQQEELKESLNASGIHLSKPLIEKVLKRIRFSHGNPIQTLEFYRYAYSKQGFIHTPFSLDTMLYILGRNRKFDLIWELLIETKRKDPSLITPRTIQIVLSRIAKLSSVKQTVESFWKFKRLLPQLFFNGDDDPTCFNALLRTLCQEKSMIDARNVYHTLKNRFRPDLQTFNILLSSWKSSEEAESFFQEMIQMGLKPDLVTYNSLIDVYCKDRTMEKAINVMEKMRNEDIAPDVITYTTIITGLGLIGQPDKAKEVLTEMKEHGVPPDVPAYNAVIRNFVIARRFETAEVLVDEMVKNNKGLKPNATTYNLFFRGFSLSNDLPRSWKLYERMLRSGCLPNTQSCLFLIRLFKRHERVDMAMKLWGDMVEFGFGSYSLVSDVLLDLLCDLVRVDEAVRCVVEMIEKGHRPSNVGFKRVKLLMELGNKFDEVKMLEEKLAVFSVHEKNE